MAWSQLFQGIGVGAVAELGTPAGGQTKLVKEDLREPLGAINVKRMVRLGIDLLLEVPILSASSADMALR